MTPERLNVIRHVVLDDVRTTGTSMHGCACQLLWYVDELRAAAEQVVKFYDAVDPCPWHEIEPLAKVLRGETK